MSGPAGGPGAGQRKRRTREHIIADLSVNHVERHVLRCGFVVNRWWPDYGIDLTLFTFDRRGHVEPGLVYLQRKASDRVRRLAGGSAFAAVVERADLAWWLVEPAPVILVQYDAAADLARWVHVQAHFAAMPGFRLSEVGRTVTIRIPAEAAFDESAVHRLRTLRDEVRRA